MEPELSRFRIAIDDATHVGELIMNRGQKLNVMDRTFFEELGQALDYLESNDRVNAVLLWAEGKLFTAGLDLKAMGTLMDPSRHRHTPSSHATAEQHLMHAMNLPSR